MYIATRLLSLFILLSAFYPSPIVAEGNKINLLFSRSSVMAALFLLGSWTWAYLQGLFIKRAVRASKVEEFPFPSL